MAHGVEIWRRPKKSTFRPWFAIRSFRQFLAETYRFATMQNVTDDRQTDRQTNKRHTRLHNPKIRTWFAARKTICTI